jgi:VIT1/CCC1 family predicted Fe2+/Mn2+ transporter
MNEPTMKPEFRAGRLTPSAYIVALEDEIDRLNEAYELAAAQATENAIAAVRAMVQLEKEREVAQLIQSELQRIIKEEARRLREMRGDHPAGRGITEVRDSRHERLGRTLKVVKEAD